MLLEPSSLKASRKPVDEIDSRSRFHQRSTYSFCARRNPESVRTQSSHQYLFTLLGSTSIKASRKPVGEIDPRWWPLVLELPFRFVAPLKHRQDLSTTGFKEAEKKTIWVI